MGFTFATPEGVPVNIMSPIFKVKYFDIYSIKVSIFHNINEVFPFCCTLSFFSNLKLMLSTFLKSFFDKNFPTTAAPSNAFDFSQGNPFSFNLDCRSLAVKSIPKLISS